MARIVVSRHRLGMERDPIAHRLYTQRTVLLFGEVTMDLAQAVTAQLIALAAESDAPIRLIVHSPGGHVESADTLYDAIRFVDAEVRVLGTGWVASAGALVYAAVPRERRYCLPNTRFLLHQPLGGTGGKVTDIELAVEQMVRIRARLQRIFAEATGQPLERLAHDMEHDFWMSATEALEYGLCGQVIAHAREM